MNAATVRVFPDAAAVTSALAQTFSDSSRSAMARHGAFDVVLSGGSTPKAAYQLLAAEPMRSEIDWPNVFVYFGDERCVPPESAESNYRMAYDALLGSVPIPSDNVFRMRGEADPAIAANEYGTLIRSRLGDHPHFDLVLLGLGENAHTASLFPGALLDGSDGTLVRAVYVASQAMWRITLTPEAINAARSVVFAVEGAAKAAALHAVLEEPRDVSRWPAQIVRPASGQLTWLVDEAAAGSLRETTR